MNVISYMYAYALYPFVTFAEQQTVAVLQSGRRIRSYENDSIQRAYAKYADRGWSTTLAPSSTNALRSKSEFRDSARSVGDSACWVISLTPVQHAISLEDYDSTPLVDPVRANSWYIILRESGQTQIGYKVHQRIANNREDAYAFTFPSASFTAGSTIQYLGNGEDAYTFKRQSLVFVFLSQPFDLSDTCKARSKTSFNLPTEPLTLNRMLSMSVCERLSLKPTLLCHGS